MIDVTKVRVPNNRIAEINKLLRGKTISMPNYRPCLSIDGDNTHKYLVFQKIDSLLKQDGSLREKLEGLEVVDDKIEMKYENYNASDAMRWLLMKTDDD